MIRWISLLLNRIRMRVLLNLICCPLPRRLVRSLAVQWITDAGVLIRRLLACFPVGKLLLRNRGRESRRSQRILVWWSWWDVTRLLVCQMEARSSRVLLLFVVVGGGNVRAPPVMVGLLRLVRLMVSLSLSFRDLLWILLFPTYRSTSSELVRWSG